MRTLITILLIISSLGVRAGDQYPWYTQGKFKPEARLEFTVSNTLDLDRENCPVIIKRENFPIPDLHEMWITIVDPDLDAKKLYIYCFYPRDSEEPYLELGPFDLPAQKKKKSQCAPEGTGRDIRTVRRLADRSSG